MKRRILLLISFFVMTSIAFSQIKVSLQAGSGARNFAVKRHAQKSKRATARHNRIYPKGMSSQPRHAATALPLQTPMAPAEVPQYMALFGVNLAPSSPRLTAVDPFANHPNPNDPLKPARPFWYSVDQTGLTILRVDDNVALNTVPWPETIDVVQPDGEYVTVNAPPDGWEPVAITVSYPTDEQLASNSEMPAAYVYVVMAHSGYEWQSNPNPPAGQDPNVRDTLVPSTNPATESAMLIQLDVTDPSFSAGAPPYPIAASILGHGAGQPAYDPATLSVYVGNMPSTSLPTTPAVPNDLTSFVSVVGELAPPAAEAAGGEAAGAPEAPLVVICGPEHPDLGVLAGVPVVWSCVSSGDGPSVWEFASLPSWLTAHVDRVTGQLDGILYGTPEVGTYSFQARVTDYAEDPAGLTSEWATYTGTVTTTAPSEEAEGGFEAGVALGQAIEGTGSCDLAPTGSPGSLVPAWVDVAQVPGRNNPNPTVPGGIEHTIGCVVMGTAPISGEHYEFTLSNFKFAYPFDREPVVFSGNVVGPYMFDPLPAGVTLSGLAWHQIDKIHDPSTEADVLNAEFFGVEPFTGQLYRILPPQGVPEGSGGGEGAAAAPETSIEGDEISAVGESLLAPFTASRTDIADALGANPNLKVRFGDLAVEASRDPRVYVTAAQILDPTGVDTTIVPIGGPTGSTITDGALIKVGGTRDSADSTLITWSAPSTINLPGVQAFFLGLDSDLSPAAPGQEPGQVDHGVLWVTGTNTGNVAVVDTVAGASSQVLAAPGASALGGVSVNFANRAAFVAGMSLHNVIVFGPEGGAPPSPRAPIIWGGSPGVGFEVTFNIGTASSFKVVATGVPTPTLSYAGALPDGVTFKSNGDGTATLAGTALGSGADYSGTIMATNGVQPDASKALLLTVAAPPVITSPNTTTFAVGVPGSFMVTATGGPAPSLLCPEPTGGAETPPPEPCEGNVPAWLTITDNGDGTFALDGTPSAGSEGSYVFTIRVSNDLPPDATQVFTLVVQAPAPPAITSASTATFTVGSAGLFTVTATGAPTPTLTYAGAPPSGVTFVINRDGTATLAGTPAAGTEGNYPFTITAANGRPPNATQDFILTVSGTVRSKAAIVSPTDGSTLPGPTVTFNWDGGSGVSNYYLWIGTTAGSHDLRNVTLGPSTTSYTATNLPITGETLFVRLYSLLNGVYEYNSYTYTSAVASKAAITSPENGSAFQDSTVTFTWSGGLGVTNYYLWIGTTEGAHDLKNVTLDSNSTSYIATNLPTTGATLYVRLYSVIGGANLYNSYTYTSAATASKAAIIDPANGSTLPGSTVTFTWSGGLGVTNYYLWIGTTEGARDLKNVTLGASDTSYTATNLPTTGATLYVRLYSRVNGVNLYNSYTYTAASLAKAAMISPVDGSTLPGSTVTFTWGGGAGVSNYYLWIGTTLGSSNLKNVTLGPSTTSYLASGLPTDGTTLYVRLYSRINGVNQYNSYTYTAASQAKAVMISPADGTTLPGSTVTFTWGGGIGVSKYYLWIGTTPGSNNLLNVEASPSTSSYMATGLPTNGETLYVRLYSRINGVNQYNSYTYTEATN